jgi:hypothetical protein
MKRFAALLVLVFIVALSRADSPLTSTFFANAYSENHLMTELLYLPADVLQRRAELKEKHLQFFDDKSVGLDEKIALLNACGFGESSNLGIFKQHLLNKYGLQNADVDSLLMPPEYPGEEFPQGGKEMHYHDLVLLSYTQAMHDYFNPSLAVKCAYRAAFTHPESEAANYVLGLILAQIYFEVDWCMLYTVMQSAKEGADYSTDRLKPEAIGYIFSYIDLYKAECNKGLLSTADSLPEENKYTADYWQQHPVYQRPESRPTYEKGENVDLVLINKPDDPNGYINRWISYDEMSDGTQMVITVANNGNVVSIETNLQIEIRAWDDSDLITSRLVQEMIPAIAPGESKDIVVIIPYYWIYDPDADFIIRLDYDDIIEEKTERNNSAEFHELG